MRACRGALPFILVVMVIALSCRSKDSCSDCEEPEEPLRPPIGLGFGFPSGDICGFSLETNDVTRSLMTDLGFVADAKINYSGDKLFLAIQSEYGIKILRLSDFSELDWVILPALPLKIELDLSGSKVYILTRNGGFWVYRTAPQVFDTLDVPIESRDFALRPPNQHEAWIVSPQDHSVNIIDLQSSTIVHTIFLNQRPASIAFSGDGDQVYIAAYGTGSAVYVIQSSSRTITDTLDAPNRIRDIAISDDGRYLTGADSSTGTIRIWDLHADTFRDVSGPRFAAHLQFLRNAHDFYALDPETGSMVRVSVTDTTAAIEDTVVLPSTTSAFALWELL